MKNAMDLLKENSGVRQRAGEGWRRWFVNTYFELIVWYESEGGAVTGFQLCLSRNRWERAFTWTHEYVSSHFVSESFVEKGVARMSTGILQGDGKAIADEEIERFERDSASLEPSIRDLVLEKVRAYNETRRVASSS